VLSRSNRLWGFQGILPWEYHFLTKNKKRGAKSDFISLFFYWLKKGGKYANRKN